MAELDQCLKALSQEYPSLARGGRLKRFFAAVESNPAFLSTCILRNVENQEDRRQAYDDDDDTVDLEVDVDGGPPQTTTETTTQKNELALLLEAARNGCCKTLGDINVNLADEDGVTALHIEADNGNYEDLEFLLKHMRAEFKGDKQGLTPLHVAASSTEPNPEIAKLLIGKVGNSQLINAIIRETSSDESTRGNTALHFAADNEQVSYEFIRALSDLDPSIKNEHGETAFHLAARAENPDVVVWMLNVFSPAKSGWKLNDIETAKGPTLLEICSQRGNAEAVALLIKYGADITQNVLFRLIDASVKDPLNSDKFIGVYRTLTENCVLWDWLKEKTDTEEPNAKKNHRPPSRGTAPEAYRKKQREIMLNLLTVPNKDHKNRNVIEYAIEKGDKLFLNEIVNTRHVFRIANKDSDEVKYNVTDFFRSSSCGCKSPCNKRTAIVDTAAESDTHTPPRPRTTRPSYLRLITEHRHLWEETDILQTEPFQTLTQPFRWFVQIIYFMMALIQLLHMVFFSIWYMPPYCSLQHRLNPDLSDYCNSSAVPPESIVINVSRFYAGLHFFWLPWPTVVFLIKVVTLLRAYGELGKIAYGCFSSRFIFPPVLLAWYISCFAFNTFLFSLTSAVHLLGWFATLSYFVSTMENASIFSFLLKRIIVKDILFSFGIVFVFVLIGFSSAIHLLREPALLGQSDYFDTMYNVFASALTTGDFMSETIEKSTDVVARFRLLQAMFAIYLCCSAIILLNILISMMNSRYKEARKMAQNIWRFHTLHSWMQIAWCFGLALEDVLQGFNVYWKYVIGIFWKRIANTAYDKVSISEDGDNVFLHLQYATQ